MAMRATAASPQQSTGRAATQRTARTMAPSQVPRASPASATAKSIPAANAGRYGGRTRTHGSVWCWVVSTSAQHP